MINCTMKLAVLAEEDLRHNIRRAENYVAIVLLEDCTFGCKVWEEESGQSC